MAPELRTKNRQPVNWDKLRPGYIPKPVSATNRKIEAIIKEIYTKAKSKGYQPWSPLEAIFMIKKTPAEALEILTQLFEAHGHEHHKAEQMAAEQIYRDWKAIQAKIISADRRQAAKKDKK